MDLVRRRLEAEPGSMIRATDIKGVTAGAASKALARLADEGVIQRVRKGVYHAPKETLLGPSRPADAALAQKVLGERARPTGITAANLLGMTTQVPAQPELATYASAPPRGIRGARLRLRRHDLPVTLPSREAALLEFLRDRGEHADVDAEETCARVLALLQEGTPAEQTKRLRRLRQAALLEPPRVRAILGALLQEARYPERLWGPLRDSLNQLSRFEFGRFRALPNAREWQAK